MNSYFINPEWYRIIFLHIAVILSLIQANKKSPDIIRPYNTSNEIRTIWILSIFFSLFIGLRPTHITFGDDYESRYYAISSLDVGKDWLFSYLEYGCKSLGFSWNSFSVLVDALYFGGTAFAISKIFKYRPLTAFAVIIAAFSFFSYSVNGLKNGVGCSMFLVALAFYKERKWLLSALFSIIAIGFHNSLEVPLAAMILCSFYKNTKLYTFIWIVCIALSLVLGDMMELVLTNVGFIDTGRDISYFNNEIYGGELAGRGFRWDFLLYSAVPIAVGYYFVFKKQYNDKYYLLILNMYILVNSIWALVNQNWLSNRMAFLSWFMYAVVLMYPILNIPELKNRWKWILYSVIGNAAFSYFMWVIGRYR